LPSTRRCPARNDYLCWKNGLFMLWNYIACGKSHAICLESSPKQFPYHQKLYGEELTNCAY
jgi:hypothetical protein